MTISSPVGTVGTYTFTSGNGRHGSYVTGYTLAQAGPGAVATAMALAGETVHQDTPATELGHSSFKGYVRPTWTAASDDLVAGRRRSHLAVHPRHPQRELT